MSSRHHNKKRNTGVVYELLLHRVTKCLVEGDRPAAQVCLNIISRHFRQGTELYREFRLFNALANAQVSGSPVAAVILTEAKDAARRTQRDQLEVEKGRLISDINRRLGADFYDTHFERYRQYATIQTLLNDWRDAAAPSDRVITYETRLVESMLSRSQEANSASQSPVGFDEAALDIMTQKLSARFSSIMSEEQRRVVRDYVFSPPGSDQTELRQMMLEIKRVAIQDLDQYVAVERNESIRESASEVRRRLCDLDLDVIDDDAVVKFLTASRLSQEIRTGDV